MIAALYVETDGAYFDLPDRMGLAKAKRLGEVAARGGGTNSTPRIHTPPEFRDLLISLARSAA